MLPGNANPKDNHRKSDRRISEVWSNVFGLCVETTSNARSDKELETMRKRRAATKTGFK